jgi:Tol biopolymer transport system component
VTEARRLNGSRQFERSRRKKKHQHIENMKNLNPSARPCRLTAMAGRFAALVSIGTALLLLAGIHCGQAAEIKIVSPSAYEETEGDGAVSDDCCAPYRYQAVFPAEDFAALGNKPHWLVGYSWRPDQSVTSPRTVEFPDNAVRLSTTQRGPDNLSQQFDDNLGSDFTQFYRGPVIAVADAPRSDPGPREFYNAAFPAGVTPYLYDPRQGNLLFDLIAWQGESPSGRADQVLSMQTALYGSSAFATDGQRIPANVFQLTFIPVPEPGPVSIDILPTGIRLGFTGIPGRDYDIERAPAVTGPWSTVDTQTAPVSGLFEYLDTHPHPGSGFYRLLRPAAWGPAQAIDPAGLNNINTSATEGCPIESPDGRSLFFASNRAGGQGGIDIWTARRDGPNESWRDPVNLPPPVNSAFDDFCPTPLPDGGLLFVSRRPNGCSENSADIYLYPNQGLLGPVILNCEVNSAGDEFSPSYVPAGGGTLFFSSNRDGTHKIYAGAPYALSSSAGEPVEVTELNAPGFNTVRPNVSEDGLEIVFDSDRPGGLGGPDVWSATRTSVTHAWSAPVNLGPNVNSVAAETRPSLSRDGRRLTFGSTRADGQGSSDLYVSTR